MCFCRVHHRVESTLSLSGETSTDDSETFWVVTGNQTSVTVFPAFQCDTDAAVVRLVEELKCCFFYCSENGVKTFPLLV